MTRPVTSYKSNRWTYFFLDDKLYKTIKRNRGTGEVYAWCYNDFEYVYLLWPHIRQYGHKALNYDDVAECLGMKKRTVKSWVYDNKIPNVIQTYNIQTGRPWVYLFSKQNVYDMHDLMVSNPAGRPPFNGSPVRRKRNYVSREEIRAYLDYDIITFAKDPNNEDAFVRVWKAETW